MNSGELARFAHALRTPGAPVDEILNASDSRAQRFDVHRNNVAIALLEALRATFPALRRLLGNDYFDALAAAFANAHPPRSRLLLHFGDELAGFLEQFEPLVDFPYLADVARLERLRIRAYHARDEAPFSATASQRILAAADEAGALRLASSTALLASAHSVYGIWRAQMDEHGLPRDLDHPQTVLVWRNAFQVSTEPVDDSTCSFLSAVESGVSLRDSLEALGGRAQNFEHKLARLLREGVLVPDFSTKTTTEEYPS